MHFIRKKTVYTFFAWPGKRAADKPFAFRPRPLTLLSFLFLFSCKDKFIPPIATTSAGHLVVEGVIDAGGDSTVFRLSRTYALDSHNPVLESDADIRVENESGFSQPVPMVRKGIYIADQLQIDPQQKYRLRISTTDGREYLSDLVQPYITSPIDSISWDQNSRGVQLYVSTTNTDTNPLYYRWEFDETWEINSYFYSTYIYDIDIRDVRPRIFPREDVFRCWKYENSHRIINGSAARLSSNVIYEYPFHFIGTNHEKLAVRYSILVRQYSMDKSAYEFFEIMRKNNEGLGTTFDALPSDIQGNIRCINDPQAIAIGYITASSCTSRRIFIDPPAGWNFSQYCVSESIKPRDIHDEFETGVKVPYDATVDEYDPTIIYAYKASAVQCVDCRSRGGELAKPSYW